MTEKNFDVHHSFMNRSGSECKKLLKFGDKKVGAVPVKIEFSKVLFEYLWVFLWPGNIDSLSDVSSVNSDRKDCAIRQCKLGDVS